MDENSSVEKGDPSAPSEHDHYKQPTNNNARPACFKSTLQEIIFVATATMAIGTSSLLAGSVTVTSSYIGRDLNMSTAEITWITSASSLSAGAFLLLFGKIADLFGRKSLFIGSFFVYTMFAFICGFAQQPITLDVLNGILGLASASAVPPAVGLLGSCYENGTRKNFAFAWFAAGNPLGFAFGALFGGIAATVFNWRASFWLISIIFLAFTILGFFTVPADDVAKKERLSWDMIKRFDPIGAFCVVFGIGLFTAALSLGDTSGWGTNYVLALLIIGLLLLAAFIVWDLWYEYPLIPMYIFKNRNFSVSLAILSLGFMAFLPGSFFLALYFQDVWHMSPIMVAVHLLPMFVVGLIINMIAGLILHKVSNKLLMWIATASYVVGFSLMAMVRKSSSYWTFAFLGQMFIVVAADFQFNVCNMALMTSFPPSQQGIAGGLMQASIRIVTALAFAIATALFNSVQRRPALASYWDHTTQPYTAVFWASVAYSGLGLCLVPFLTIGTQGDKRKSTASILSNAPTQLRTIVDKRHEKKRYDSFPMD